MAECSICLEQLNEKNIAVLYCGHYYHVECILDWSNQKNNCPMCNQQIKIDHIIKKYNCKKKEIISKKEVKRELCCYFF